MCSCWLKFGLCLAPGAEHVLPALRQLSHGEAGQATPEPHSTSQPLETTPIVIVIMPARHQAPPMFARTARIRLPLLVLRQRLDRLLSLSRTPTPTTSPWIGSPSATTKRPLHVSSPVAEPAPIDSGSGDPEAGSGDNDSRPHPPIGEREILLLSCPGFDVPHVCGVRADPRR